jgi:hypothetical protein
MASLDRVISELEGKRKEAQQQLDRLNSAIAALRGMNGNSGSRMRSASGPRRVLSVAARKRIAAAQRARWARFKQQQKKAA